MRKSILLFAGALLLCAGMMLWFQSCKKSDQVRVITPNKEKKFFTVPASAPGTVERIAAFIREQNSRYQFLDQLIRKEGYIIWDKGNLYTGKLPNSSSTDTIVVLPMVLENDRQVNSFLACKVRGNKIDVYLHRGRRYNKYTFSDNAEGLTATRVTLELMYLQQKVFGDSVFRVNDPRLFGAPGQKGGGKTVRIRTQPLPVVTLDSWISFIVDRCYYLGDDGDEGQVVGVPPGGSNNYPYGEWICYASVVHVLIPDNEGGAANPIVNPDPGGGGGGNGQNSIYGWWSYDPCEVPDPNGPQGPQEPGGDGPTEPCINGIRQVWHPLNSLFHIGSISGGFTNPCIAAAKNALNDQLIKAFGQELLIQSEENETWHIAFSENRNMAANKLGQSYPDPDNPIWHVELNPIWWEQATYPNASQETAALTMLHEIIHGLIHLYKVKYNLQTFDNFSAHTIMFQNFVYLIKNTLLAAYPNLSAQDAAALAISGLDDALKIHFIHGGPTGYTPITWDQTYDHFSMVNYGVSVLAARNIYVSFLTGNKGTKCF